MAKKPRKTTKKTRPAKKTSTPAEVPFSPSRHINVSATRTVNLGNYESVKVSAGFSTNLKDDEDLEEAFKDAYDKVENAVEDQIDRMDLDVPEEDEKVDEPEEDEEVDEDPEEDEDITEEEINKMKKKDLLKLIKEEKLEVDTSQKLADIREDVIDEMFEEDEASDGEDDDGEDASEDGEDEDWEDDEWED